MLKFPQLLTKFKRNLKWNNAEIRTFLSQAYYCNEVWDNRLKSQVLAKVNLDEFYCDLEQRFQKTRQISAVDVNVFANATSEGSFDEELLDLLHKLRLSADTSNTLDSTSHAVVRNLLTGGKKDELLSVLDDRLNYGIFLDHYTANILLDTFWKENDYVSGARIASQLMLQEDSEHPITFSLALLHCYNFLLSKQTWPEIPKPEEPIEEVKIRVKYLRNEFNDGHFDLVDPIKIVGKTLIHLTQNKNDSLNISFKILGYVLHGDTDKAKIEIERAILEKIVIYKETLELVTENEEIKTACASLTLQSANVQDLLTSEVKKAERNCSEKDITRQCEMFNNWETERSEALEHQKQRLLTMQRLQNIEDLKEQLKEKERKLWFFEKEEQIELDIKAKNVKHPRGINIKSKKVDENYIPPEVRSRVL